MNSLWLNQERRQALRSALKDKESWLVVLAAKALDRAVNRGSDASGWVVGAAVHALLLDRNGDDLVAAWSAEARSACALQDLTKARVAMTGAILADCTLNYWSPDEQAVFIESANALCAAFLQISSGNPHQEGNNWWAVTHSALFALSSALDAAGDTSLICGRTARELSDWAWARLEAFMGHIGPSGGYHEGLGYMGYTYSYLLPAVLLWEARTGERCESFAPGLSRIAQLIFCAAIEGEAQPDELGAAPGWGRMLSWNDAGTGWLSGPAPLLAICLAPEAMREELRGRWDKLSGHLVPNREPVEVMGSLFFHTAYYQLAGGGGSASPTPLTVADSLHGLWIARNRYCDSGDAVAGAYARAYHPGGHTQSDAGSIRFSARGRDWILGGGQARPAAELQSRVLPSDHDDKQRICGAPIFVSSMPPAFGMDLRRVYRCYGERYVALRPSPIHSQLAVLDLIDDHLANREWYWTLTFASDLHCAFEEDRFILTGPEGGQLEGAFLLDRPDSFELLSTPTSTRTYSSGKVAEYQGRSYLRARFKSSHLRIFVSLAVDCRPAQLEGADQLTIAYGSDLWMRPFGNAFPSNLRTSQLHTQCRYPC